MALQDNALATLAELKEFLDITGTTYDDLLTNLLNRVTDLFHTYCGVTQFKAQNYTDYYDGSGDSYLFINNTPINSVSLLADDTDHIWASDSTFASDEYRIVEQNHIVVPDSIFSSYDQNIKITYNAGYDTIPGDLKQTCIEEAGRRYKHRRDFDVVTKTMDDGTIQYTQRGLMPSTTIILDKYKVNMVY